MEKRWNLRTPSDEELKFINDLSKQLNINHVLAQLLVQRGIRSFEEAKDFFRPQLENLHDPFLMNDMRAAVDRLNTALGHKERILVYGDYDVDGTSSVALIYSFLRHYTSALDYYIPDRYTEGYGISYEGIDYAKETGATLIVALDCGIKAIDKVAYAKEKGIDFIICDHHTPDEILPDAVAVLDPKRPDSTYPFKHLSGCGVGYKLIQAFALDNHINCKEVRRYLDLVVVSIASDIVPITGENRILAYWGLRKLNSNPRIGLKTIIDISGLDRKEITISDIVFKIGPRINASGRMYSGKEAVELMVATDLEEARAKCLELNEYNQERKDLDKGITEEALQHIEDNDNLQEKKSTVLYNPEWHKGIIGIVASRLIEKYYRPTIILTKSNNKITGSARSVAGFNIYNAIEHCKDLLENFGGHKFAAGLTMKEENLEEFKRRFEEFVASKIQPVQTIPQIDIDARLNFSSITPKFFRILSQFAPFGPENMKPVFITENVRDSGGTRLVGKDADHLKVELADPEDGIVLGGIGFSMSQFNDHLKKSRPVDICYTIEENSFNGNRYIQLMIKDIKEK
ncbi:single-stranded-DNA-specific exonuclease RecJ [Saccharicrinis sp. FJH2]|uniref:single-stranded-DNA-specific exonuclease RecJ n=1 Tax=unclassified Saccharicrinis TaxID=2646859 RepID=UPI0035D47698